MYEDQKQEKTCIFGEFINNLIITRDSKDNNYLIIREIITDNNFLFLYKYTITKLCRYNIYF